MFQIDPAFLPTSDPVGDLGLCHVRLQADARYPWLLLIPAVSGAQELEDLSPDQRAMLMSEVVAAGEAVRAMGPALGLAVEKLNVGQLGNVTPQLHVHVIGRRRDDPAWPGPVWGHGSAMPMTDAVRRSLATAARRALGL